MKSIFFKLTPYIIGFLAINIISYESSNFFKKERQYLERIEQTISSQSEIVFLGDSHVETIKLLELSKNVGNLSFGADGIEEMYVKTLIMNKYNQNLKYIFISTEPQIFNNSLSSNSTFLNRYLSDLKNSKNVYDKTRLDLIVERVPLFNDSYLKYILNTTYLNIKNFNRTKKKVDWQAISEVERKSIAINTGKIDHHSIMSDESGKIIFRDIIETSKAKDIKIIGIRFPVNENYIKQCSQKDMKNVNNFIENLNLDYNLDYSIELKNPKYFHDEDHLNGKGVEKLSKLIFKDTGIKLTN